ncbi:hypothetical protein KI387_024656, partial [Taxus chinensis]
PISNSVHLHPKVNRLLCCNYPLCNMANLNFETSDPELFRMVREHGIRITGFSPSHQKYSPSVILCTLAPLKNIFKLSCIATDICEQYMECLIDSK